MLLVRLCSALLVLMSGVSGAAPDVVQGEVRDVQERPVAGARVRLTTASGTVVAEVDSDAQGQFAIRSEVRGTSLLSANKEGFATAYRSVALPVAERVILPLRLAVSRNQITVTASRGSIEDAAEASSMVETRDRDSFLSHPMPTMGQALESSPNIMIQQTSASQVSPFLRGLTGYQVLNLVDGVRFNNSTFRSGPNQYLAFLEPSQAQRVESTLGPSSAMYGSDSMGGTIQILTREPRFGTSRGIEIHGGWNAFGATADLSGGTDGQVVMATDRWSWTVGATGRKHSDLRAGGATDSRHVLRRFFSLDQGAIQELAGGRQQDTGFAQWGVDSKFAARLTSQQSLSFWYQQSTQRDARIYKDLWGGLGRLESGLAPQRLNFGYVRYERLNLGWLDSLSGTFSANAQADGSRRQNLRATDSITTDDSQINVFGYSAQAATHAGRRQAIVFGGEYYDEHIGSVRLLTNPVSGNTSSSRPLYPDGSRYRTAALFGQDRLEFGRLRVTVGGRWTRIGYKTQSDSFGTAESSQSFQDLTFNAAAAFRLGGGFSLHALAGRGFRAPNANDLGAIGLNDLGYEIPAADAVPAGALLSASSGEGALSLGRPITGLAAERLFSTEFGLRWVTRTVQVRSQFFNSDLYDPIVRRTLLFAVDRVPASLAGMTVTPIPPTAAQQAQGVVTVATAIDPRAVKAFVNDGRSRYYGTENSVRWILSPHWTIDANYSYLVGRDLNPNRNIRRLPPQQAYGAVRYNSSRYWIQASVQASGAQRRLSGGDLDDERIGASRSRNDIAAVFQGTRLSEFVQQGLFAPTGETLRQVQDRVLPGVSDGVRVPLYTSTAGWATVNVEGGWPLNEWLTVNGGLYNLLDHNYRIHGSGVDSPGLSAFLGFRLSF